VSEQSQDTAVTEQKEPLSESELFNALAKHISGVAQHKCPGRHAGRAQSVL